MFYPTNKLVDGVATKGEFLHVERVLPDILDHWVCSILEDVDDVRRLDLALSLSLLLLRPSNCLQLTHTHRTLGTRHRRTSAATRIISQLYYMWGEQHVLRRRMDDQMLMALSLPWSATAAS